MRTLRSAIVCTCVVMAASGAPNSMSVASGLASPSWTKGGPFGGAVPTLVQFPLDATHWYAVDGGLFVSSNSGASWHRRSGSGGVPGTLLAVHPADPSILYAAD